MVIATTTRDPEPRLHVHLSFASEYVHHLVPKFFMRVLWNMVNFEEGLRYPFSSMPNDTPHPIINDKFMLDGAPATWMEPEFEKLIMASLNKNYGDMNEYPVTIKLHGYRYCYPKCHMVLREKHTHDFISCF